MKDPRIRPTPKNCKIQPGQPYERLTVVGFVGRDKWGQLMWLCSCICGGEKIVRGHDLRNKKTRSCGCLERESRIKHGMEGTSEYHTWAAMLDRCRNPKNETYKNYGGRGITVCKAWHKFGGFFKDMGKRPTGLTLERKNNDLGYFPENCIWATRIAQANNRRAYPKNRKPISSDFCKQFVAGHIATKKVFKSNNQSRFAQEHNLCGSGISACLRGKMKKHKGWMFKWL